MKCLAVAFVALLMSLRGSTAVAGAATPAHTSAPKALFVPVDEA